MIFFFSFKQKIGLRVRGYVSCVLGMILQMYRTYVIYVLASNFKYFYRSALFELNPYDL